MAGGPAAAEDVPGEVRSALAPSKPQRTASMRDHAVSQPPVKKRPAALPSNRQDYEVVDGPRSPVADSPVKKNKKEQLVITFNFIGH